MTVPQSSPMNQKEHKGSFEDDCLQHKKKPRGNPPSSKPSSSTTHLPKLEPSDDAEKPKRLSKKSKINDYGVSGDVKTLTMERAERLQASLPSEHPSFIKFMLVSHVTRVFWLGLPRQFCRTYMPKQDTEMVLEDESGKEFIARYLVDKDGLSGGWKGFSAAHHLAEGDVVVFQLIKPSKFKVYIVRSNIPDEVDGGSLNLEVCGTSGGLELADQSSSENAEADDMCLESPPDEIVHEIGNKETAENGYDYSSIPMDVLEGVRLLSESNGGTQEVGSITEFPIVVDDLVIDSEFPKYYLTKYYGLCQSQNSVLHENLVAGLNCKFAAGIIMETVNIADAIRVCKQSTPKDELDTWDRTLGTFEELGMSVGFLRDKLKLLSAELDPDREEKLKKAAQAKKAIEALQAKLLEAAKKIDADIQALQVMP